MFKRAFIFCFSIGLFCGFISSAIAKDKPAQAEAKAREMEKAIFMASSSEDRVLKIGLVDCMLYALKQNSEVLVKRIDPKLKADDVKIAQADFEPVFSGEYSIEDNTELASSSLQGATTFNSLDMNYSAGASGKLITGTEYEIDFLNERYKSDSSFQIFNPYYTVTPKVTITQPLFKGFGILVNRADIIIAQNDKAQSEKSFKDTVINTISSTKTAYYNYVFSLENYSLDRLASKRTIALLAINRARYKKGLMSSVDLLESEAAAAEKEKAVVSSAAAVKKSEDELKLVTNLIDDPEVWNAKIELIDQPEFKVEEVSLLECLKNAFIFRPDYQSAQIDLKNRDVKIQVAKNALLPTIDLTGSYALNGLEESYDKAAKNANANFIDWFAGVEISVPWGGGDRAKYNQRKLEKTQAILSLKRLEQNIMLEVRDKVREVRVQRRQVEVAKLSKEKEKQNYAAQKERYAVGQVSTHDMLDYQDKLAKAELDYVKALIDYNLALINLDRTQGITLAKNNIKLEG